MIHCTIHNYRDWMGAYMEGTMSPADMNRAEIFLEQHPEILDQYLLELEELKLEPDTIEFTGKTNLSVNIAATSFINIHSYQEIFIAHYEKELNTEQVHELNTFLSLNPFLEKEFKILGKVYVTPDASIIYPDKKDLLKRTGTIVPVFWRISAAASVILLLTLGTLLLNRDTTTGNGVALSAKGNVTPAAVGKNETIVLYRNISASAGGSDSYATNGKTSDNDEHTHPQHSRQPKLNPTHPDWDVNSQEEKSNSVAINQTVRPSSESVHELKLRTVLIEPLSGEIAMKQVPEVEQTNGFSDAVAENKPRKNGIFSKIISGEKTYIEDFVNATFTAFKDDKKEDSKWVLKVDRDNNGKSRKIKFSSPFFSLKSND